MARKRTVPDAMSAVIEGRPHGGTGDEAALAARRHRRVGQLDDAAVCPHGDHGAREFLADPAAQHGGLQRADRAALQARGHRIRGGHDRRQRRKRGPKPLRHGVAGAQRLADEQAEPVDEPAQRRRRVRIGRRNRGLNRAAGTLPSKAVYPAPRNNDAAACRMASCCGSSGSSIRRYSPYATPCGHGRPSAAVCRRNCSIAGSPGGGIVRRMPMRPSSMILAAAIPVIRESCAFQPSTGSGRRRTSSYLPCAFVISWSALPRLAPPRSRSSTMRASPISRSRTSSSDARPASNSACTCA